MDTANELVHLTRERLYSAVLSDTLDELGLLHQIMASNVRPLNEQQVLCGRARTGDYKDVYHSEDASEPYALVVALMGSLGPDEVVVLACGKSGRIHPFGETQATVATLRGAAGCVMDGLMRDTRQVRELGLPCFSAGYGAIQLPGRGRMVAMDVPVNCGGVWVSPGDLIYGDMDGVIVIPRAVEEQVVRAALQRAERERAILSELRAGATLEAVYRKYRTL
jgi:regulator of RNase E activity RraA